MAKEKRMSAGQILESLKGDIKAHLETKPEVDGLDEHLRELFKSYGLKPNKKGIKKIVSQYIADQEAEAAENSPLEAEPGSAFRA